MAVILHSVKIFLTLLILHEYLKQYRMDEQYLMPQYILFFSSNIDHVGFSASDLLECFEMFTSEALPDHVNANSHYSLFQ